MGTVGESAGQGWAQQAKPLGWAQQAKPLGTVGETADVCNSEGVTVLRIIALFVLAAVAEIGGAWLVWQTIRESKPWWFAGLGALALAGYGFIASLQPDANFGRVLAAYGGIFVAGSLAWGVFIDGFRPTVWDYVGSIVCLAGAAIIISAPAAARGD